MGSIKKKKKPEEGKFGHKSRRKRDYGLLFLELFTVTFGVMLGFFVNQLKEDRKAEKNLTIAVKLVNSEIVDNLKESERLYSKNKNGCLWLFETADSLAHHKNMKQGVFYISTPEISLFNPAKTAWETFKQQGLTGQMEFQHVADITKIYSTISFMEKINDQLMDVLSNGDFYDPDKTAMALNSFISLVNQQLNIDESIRNAIVEYLTTYDKDLLKDTINFNRIRTEFIEQVKNTNYVKNLQQ